MNLEQPQIHNRMKVAITILGLVFVIVSTAIIVVTSRNKSVEIDDTKNQEPLSLKKFDRDQKIINSLSKGFQKNPQDFIQHLALGKYYEDANDSKQAMKYYQSGLQLKPDNASLNWYMGMLYLKQKEAEEKIQALPCFRQVLRVEPNHPQKKIIENYITQLETFQQQLEPKARNK